MKLVVLILLSLPVLVFGNSVELQMRAMASKIYTSSGLKPTDVPMDVFYNHYKEYASLKSRGKVKGSLITFLNFDLISGKPRLVVVNVSISNPKVIVKELVAHGRKSGSYWKAKEFSNKSKSYQSSLGTYITKEPYHSKRFGPAMRMDGITPGLNTNVRSRAIVFHSGWYVNYPSAILFRAVGKSLGCFTVRKKVVRSLVDLLKNGGMIVAFNSQYRGRSIISTSNDLAAVSSGSSSGVYAVKEEEILLPSETPYFSNSGSSNMSRKVKVKDVGSILKYAGILGIGLVGVNQLIKIKKNRSDRNENSFSGKNNKVKFGGEAEIYGSSNFEQCQMLADRPWKEVVYLVQEKRKNPYSFFTASYKDLQTIATSPIAIDNGQIPLLARNHMKKVNSCAALATHFDIRNTGLPDMNRKLVRVSNNKKLECAYEGAESADFHECMESINSLNQLESDEKKLVLNQEKGFIASNEKVKDELTRSNTIQTASISAAKKIKKNVVGLANMRELFKKKKLNVLSKRLSAFRSKSDLYNLCRSRLDPFKNESTRDYVAFNSVMSQGFDYSLGTIGLVEDSCRDSLEDTNIVYMQNNKAKDQIVGILKDIGIEKTELESKIAILKGQKNPDLLLNKSATLSMRVDMGNKKLENDKSINYNNVNTKNDLSNSNRNIENSSLKIGSRGNDLEDRSGQGYSSQTDNTYTNTNDSDLGIQKTFKAVSGGVLGHSGGYDGSLEASLKYIREGNVELLANHVMKGETSWGDLEYAFGKGLISKKDMIALTRLTGKKVRKVVSFNQIENDKGKNIFSIISSRYSKELIKGSVRYRSNSTQK